MTTEKLNIEAVVEKVNFMQKQFVIAKVIKSSHETYNEFAFKGFSNKKINIGDHVLITKGYFNETKYGVQIENGSLLVIKKSLVPKDKVNNIKVNNNIVINQENKNFNTAEIQDFKLTNEQIKCINATKSGDDVKIKAYAGTGKTSTLVEISKSLKGRGLYLAYNKAIQIDASNKFPSSVTCKTAHSLAYGGMYAQINGRVENMTPIRLMSNLDVSAIGGYQPFELAFLILKLLRAFCNSSFKSIDDNFIDSPIFSTIGDNESQNKEIINYVSDKANEYWIEATKENSQISIEHDFYLKMYQLSEPNLSKRFDYILFDECQDANPVLIDIITKQSIQKISVGDEHQQIYSWRGAINSYDQLNGEDYYLSQSFRFGSKIAEFASLILYIKGETIPLKGKPDIESIITDDKPIIYTQLCRTNANMIEKIIDNIKKKIHVVGGTREILDLAKSGYALYQKDLENVTHSKIRSFKSWDKMIEFKEKFDDPDISFLARIIEKHGDQFSKIISKIENAKYVQEENATVIFSTIHKAKGREWNNVNIGDDFTLFFSDDGLQELIKEQSEKFNLLYVAITRAKHTLSLDKECKRFLYRVHCYCKPIIEKLVDTIESKDIVDPEVKLKKVIHDVNDGLPF